MPFRAFLSALAQPRGRGAGKGSWPWGAAAPRGRGFCTPPSHPRTQPWETRMIHSSKADSAGALSLCPREVTVSTPWGWPAQVTRRDRENSSPSDRCFFFFFFFLPNFCPPQGSCRGNRAERRPRSGRVPTPFRGAGRWSKGLRVALSCRWRGWIRACWRRDSCRGPHGPAEGSRKL